MSVTLYEINAGVRRAKAHQVVGRLTIRAQIGYPDGTQGAVIEVPIMWLRSPHKDEIDISAPHLRCGDSNASSRHCSKAKSI